MTGSCSIDEISARGACRWRPTITFSIARMLKKICRFWNVRPIPFAARCEVVSPVTSSPARLMRPAVGA
jgi:hypothetical protein